MGIFDSLKKSMELKQPENDSKTTLKDLENIKKIEKKLEKNPDSFNLLYELYGCYIDLSDTSKKIECLEKMIQIKPNNSFPLGQLAQIYYGELQNPQKGKYYQDKANRINSNKFL
jgi:tetratricopeptide (TPR) repeat protein